MIPVRHAGAFESTSNASSYTNVAGAYMDLDAGGTFAQFGAKGPGSIGVKLRTILAGVALTVLAFTSAGAATLVDTLRIGDGSTGTATLTLGPSAGPSINGVSRIKMINSNTVKNWQICHNDSVSGVFQIMPSTANGGSTFTSSVFNLSTTGTLTLAGGLETAGQHTSTAIGLLYSRTGATTALNYFDLGSTGGRLQWGIEGTSGAQLLAGSGAYDVVFNNVANTNMLFAVNNTMKMTLALATLTIATATTSIQALTATTMTVTTSSQIDGLMLSRAGDANNNWAAWQQGTIGWRAGMWGSTLGGGRPYDLVLYVGAVTPTASVPGTVAIRVLHDTQAVVFTGSLIKAGDTFLNRSTVAMANGAGVGIGTLTNAPAAGNPTKWLQVDDNGTQRYVPAW